MLIPRALHERMIAHALADAPDECCGIIGSRGGRAVALYEAQNTAHSPLRYVLDSDEQRRIVLDLDDNDLDLGAIYHSHTRSAPYPSQTDINLAHYPDALYIIIGVANRQEPEVRAFSIRAGVVEPALLQII